MVQKQTAITHPRLQGVRTFSISGEPVQGEPQQVLVLVEPGIVIPRHQHGVDATMFVVSGSATLLADDNHNGLLVKVGHRIEFAKNRSHGFIAGTEGLSFLSTNGGIIDANGDWDIAFT